MKNIEITAFYFEPLNAESMKLVSETCENYSSFFNETIRPLLSDEFKDLKKITIYMDDDFDDSVVPLNKATGIIEVYNDEEYSPVLGDDIVEKASLQLHLTNQLSRLSDYLNIKEDKFKEVYQEAIASMKT